MKRPVLLLVALSVAVTAGCKKKRPPPSELDSPWPAASAQAAKKEPPAKTPDGAALVWSEESSQQVLKVTGLDGLKGTWSCDDALKCSVRIDKAPKGTRLQLGASPEETASYGFATASVDGAAAIGQAKIDDAYDYQKRIDLKQKVVITFPDGVRLEGPLPPLSVKFDVTRYFEKRLPDERPAPFGDESEPISKGRTILFQANSLSDARVLGPGTKLRDVDYVALPKSLPKRPADKKCSGYTRTNGGGEPQTLDLFLIDKEVKLFERRTGKLVETKTFAGTTTCPMFASGGEATSYADDDAIVAWLRTRR